MSRNPVRAVCTLLTLALAMPAAATHVVDFEDVGANLPIDGDDFYDGRSAADPGDPDATDFTSGGAAFNNEFTEFFPGCCWQGWSYSQTTDTTTPSIANQYSAWPGAGVGGSATYGVAFTGSAQGVTDIVTIDLDAEQGVVGGFFANTTVAALSMLNGDGFADAFGGTSGDDPDWLKLTITGLDALDAVTGTVDLYLADYRFADNDLDYILEDWTWLDLTSLGQVASLDFALDSSDADFGFLNTPSYFALDGLVVPEPASGSLLALGLTGLARVRRRR